MLEGRENEIQSQRLLKRTQNSAPGFGIVNGFLLPMHMHMQCICIFIENISITRSCLPLVFSTQTGRVGSDDRRRRFGQLRNPDLPTDPHALDTGF